MTRIDIAYNTGTWIFEECILVNERFLSVINEKSRTLRKLTISKRFET
jgi:Fe-S cluster biosynthesis and repair protein YggX